MSSTLGVKYVVSRFHELCWVCFQGFHTRPWLILTCKTTPQAIEDIVLRGLEIPERMWLEASIGQQRCWIHVLRDGRGRLVFGVSRHWIELG